MLTALKRWDTHTYIWYCTPHSLLFIRTDSNLLAQISHTLSHYLPLYFIKYSSYQKMFQIKHFYVQYKCLHVKHDQQNHKYLTEDKVQIVVLYIYIFIYVPKLISLRNSHSTKFDQNSLRSFRTRTDAKLPDNWAYMTSPLCSHYTLCTEVIYSLHIYL